MCFNSTENHLYAHGTTPSIQDATEETHYPYSLTLSLAERRAIDWVDHRYGHGNDLFDILADTPNGEDGWDCSKEDIVYELEQWQGWAIHAIGEESDFRWDCFAPTLADKLTVLCDSIV